MLGQHCLYKAMEANHPMLRTLLRIGAEKSRWDSHAEVEQIAAKPSTPKAATMTTLAAVLSAWEDSTGKHTWRNVTAWDTRVLRALTEWGYRPSDVERLLLGEEQPDTTTADDCDDGVASADATHSAA